VEPRRAVPLVFVAETQLEQIGQWRNWLNDNGMAALEKLALQTAKCGKQGYSLPGYWPPDTGSAKALDWIAFFSRRLDYIADKTARQTEVRRASPT